jgi:diguanylate cyclase (GGDEF)-like protein/PAS domain S-box-containing protein
VTIVVAASGPSQRSTLAPALRDLARARARARLMRALLWAWHLAILVWLLPLGPWSASALPPAAGLAAGVALGTVAAVLVLLHRRASRTDRIRAAVSAARDAATVDSAPADGGLLSLDWEFPLSETLTLAAGALLLAAPLISASLIGDRVVGWLLQPVGALLLAARWRWRGAFLGIAAGLGILGIGEGAMHDWANAADPALRTVLMMCAVLIVVNPIAVSVFTFQGSEREGAAEAESRRAVWRARRVLRTGDQRVHALLDGASDMVSVLDADGIRREVSPSVTSVLGYRPEELVGASFFALVHPDDVERVVDYYVEMLYRPGFGAPIELRYRDHVGDWRYLEAVFNNLLDDPEVGGLIVSARDITERKAFEAELTRQAYHDALTGLPNRSLFMAHLTQALAAPGADRHELAVMFVDLDRFKNVNDSLGHSAGDSLLVAVAQRLSSCIRAGDMVARFGGDEFTVLLGRINGVDEAVQVAHRMIEQIHRPFMLDGHEVCTGASIGIRPSRPPHGTAEDLLRDADAALYQAKGAGKGRAIIFDAAMVNQAAERLDLETDLSLALRRGELRLYYQPEVDIATGEVAGMEALLRWQHPRRGIIGPAEFIPLAEETGLIVPIGRWALEEACRQARAWESLRQGRGPLVMSVNLSVQQLQQSGFVADVAAILRRTGMDPRNLRLEITESMLLDDVEPVIGTLTALKALGVQLALDDFGTGYSSLNYLTQFAADTLKIDQSFIRRLESDDGALAIVHAITTLAQALGMNVTAEGIETAEQLAKAQLLCDHGQGFYFSEPVTGDELTRLLRRKAAWSIEDQRKPA